MTKVLLVMQAEYDPINDEGERTTLPAVSDVADALSEEIGANVTLILRSETDLGPSEDEKERADKYHDEYCDEDGCRADSDLREQFPCTKYVEDTEREEGLSSYA